MKRLLKIYKKGKQMHQYFQNYIYGKAVAFKEEFGRKVPKKRPCSPSAEKPTMADIAAFTPE